MRRFLDIPESFQRLEESLFVVLPVPYECSTTYARGTREAPEAILRASHQIEEFDEEFERETYRVGIHTLPPFEFGGPPEELTEVLYEHVRQLITKDRVLVTLGGEHTISLGVIKAFREKYPRLDVLQFDAHCDLRDEYQGCRYNHACVMRRVLELCEVTQVGIRSLSQEEFSFYRQRKVRMHFAREIVSGLDLGEKILASLGEHIYVTIDMDVFDPAEVPGVGNPEPGGLSWYGALKLFERIFMRRKVVGFDLVELRPLLGAPASEVFAARLAYRLMGYIAKRRKLLV
jgi:agmatinase